MAFLKSIKYSVIGGILVVGLGFALCWWGPFCSNRAENGAVPKGRTLDSRRIDFNGLSFDVVKLNPERDDLRLFWKDSDGKPYNDFLTLKSSLEASGKHLLFATNAGIFSADNSPGGLHIENGNEIKSLNLRDGAGNFHLKPNGVFLLGAEGAGVVESHEFMEHEESVQIAAQSGPMLVIDGNIHPAFHEGSPNLYIRNGVGVDKDGNIHFAISNQRVNFFDFASFFKDQLGCPNALYLDGSISQFYLPDLEREENAGNYAGIFAVVGP